MPKLVMLVGHRLQVGHAAQGRSFQAERVHVRHKAHRAQHGRGYGAAVDRALAIAALGVDDVRAVFREAIFREAVFRGPGRGASLLLG
jgi:hypothetical protein